MSENLVDEISKFKKEVKFIYEEMNRPYYKSNAKASSLSIKAACTSSLRPHAPAA